MDGDQHGEGVTLVQLWLPHPAEQHSEPEKQQLNMKQWPAGGGGGEAMPAHPTPVSARFGHMLCACITCHHNSVIVYIPVHQMTLKDKPLMFTMVIS